MKHVLRAVYEGVVFSHMTHFERLMRIRSRPTAIRATGGAARSPVWMQMLADALQLPVELPAGSELGALGAALSAGVAVGCYRDFEDACSRTVRWVSRFEPDSQQGEIYRAKYARYRRLLEAMQGRLERTGLAVGILGSKTIGCTGGLPTRGLVGE